ncbi:MAG: carbamate kinase [Deltaproteobacteria bacterium]|nr:carbamate kinase [Deltaproteobacteria bacterium]
MSNPVAVVAFGGNALIRAHETGTLAEQIGNAERAVKTLMRVIERGFRLLIVHGNGPQAGIEMIRVEESVTKVPPVTLDMCVANTQGSMAFLLQSALYNECTRRGIAARVATVVTQVVVDSDDPGFENPTKPVGPFFTEYRARQLMKKQGWKMTEDSGRGWRKVVSSPHPKEIIEADAVRSLLGDDQIVIAGGGGGIPVVRLQDSSLKGVEAVIDKDYTASLLAREVKAHLFVILTAVDRISIDFGKPTERPLRKLTPAEARRFLDEGQFPPGSMGPKVNAAVEFLEGGGREVIVTDDATMEAALEGRGGTTILHEGVAEDWGGQQVLFW